MCACTNSPTIKKGSDGQCDLNARLGSLVIRLQISHDVKKGSKIKQNFALRRNRKEVLMKGTTLLEYNISILHVHFR